MTHQNTNSNQKAVSVLKKVASIIFFLTVFYLIPLIGKYSLLVNWRVIFLATICTILFATQPRLSIAESKEKKSTDRNTIWLILIGSGIGQITSLIEWAYFSDKIIIGWTIIGASLLIVGTFFRLYAIYVLGKYFSSTVQIKEEHKIISIGPYKYLRHPSYTGAYLAMLGSAVFLHSIIGILIFGIGMLFVYRLRIKTEEQTLINKFKDEYLNYSEHTYKMFPLIW
ncbi:MAG: isoprenylcysteine carboxylmethyltransferase family protein [Bacteroidota bacterium]